MADERNFRMHYYEKVGFRTVEAHKSLQMLLKDTVQDKAKLGEFCLRYSPPPQYRALVWNLILGVLPPQTTSHEYVQGERKAQYTDLKSTLSVLGLPPPLSHSQLLALMMLLEEGRLPLNPETELDSAEVKLYVSVCDMVQGILEEGDESDVYWVTTLIFRHKLVRSSDALNLLCETTEQLVRSEDARLHEHVTSINAWAGLPLSSWFTSAFSALLPPHCCDRVWDKLVAGAPGFLAHIAAAVLVVSRRAILAVKPCASAAAKLNTALAHLSDDGSEMVLQRALETWQKHGYSSTTPLPRGDSPNL